MPKYADARAFDIALHARIRDIARSHGIDLPRARREIAYDRFLARLNASSEPGQWLLKGGVALDLRFPAGATRRTRDVDMETPSIDGIDGARRLIRGAAGARVDDFFVFAITKEPSAPIFEGVQAYRFTIDAQLNGRTFEAFACDVGVSDRNVLAPEVVQGRSLLAFAGIESPQVLALPLNEHIADKVHAFARTHDGRASSRAKDLVDLALLAAYRDVASAGELRGAIARAFAAAEMPKRLPEPDLDWARQYPLLAKGLPIPGVYEDAVRSARGFIDPVLGGDVDGSKSWNSARSRWEESGEKVMRLERRVSFDRRVGRERGLAR